MDIRVLHAADLHLDSPFSSFPEDQTAELKTWQRKIPDRLLQISNEYSCNLWLLAGDIFDGAVSLITVTALQRVFRNCGVPVLIAPGNHDSYSAGSPWTQFQWPDNVHIFHSDILQAVEFPELNCRVWGAAFLSMDSGSVLSDFSLDRKFEHELCVVHGDAVNTRSAYNPVNSVQVRESHLDYIALGHTHSRGCLQFGETVCGWPGCPMGRGWDEKGDKGVYICDISDHVDIQFESFSFPGFYEIELTDPDEIEITLPPFPEEDHFRVIIRGKKPASLQELYSRFSFLKHIEFVDCTVLPSDPWDNVQSDSFKGVFFRILHQEFEQADSADSELIALAAQISQDILNGEEVDLS